MADKDVWTQNEFLSTYLQYVKDTESPKLMHVWSAISAASACMGRHIHLPFGTGDIHANMFVLLVGPPATRKSSAVNYASNLLKENTGVRFAPDDTGGQRQGLITAIEGQEQLDTAEQEMELMVGAANIAALTDVGSLNMSVGNVADSHHIFACASEFGTFMGDGNVNMTRFLNKVWDGEDYHYKLKNEQKVLKEPLMTIVGATTTSDIAKILPAESIGQGFMSRWILAFAPSREKKVSRPKFDEDAKKKIIELFAYLNYDMKGAMKESIEAELYMNALYETKDIDLNDSRFLYYAERRHTHLQKLAMILAATRKSMVIEVKDVKQADSLLIDTEKLMPEALGEFGLSPVGAAKQKLVEFLQHSREAISARILWSMMQRDMKQSDFTKALADLTIAKKIVPVTTDAGQAYIYKCELDDIVNLMGED